MRRGGWIAALGVLSACQPPTFTEPQVLGGMNIPASTLNRGKKLYERHCRSCHGVRGDGVGPSSYGQWPSPRDFRRAKFKYAGVLDRGLPPDDALVRVIQNGLPGTAMPPWDLPDAEVRDIVHYLKTFSHPGRGFRNPKLKVQNPEIPPNPFATDVARKSAVANGERLYHTVFQCAQCHPQYVGPEAYTAWDARPSRAEFPLEPVPKPSVTFGNVLLPPDFTRHRMRSVRTNDDGTSNTTDMYRVIAFGLQGPMPGYVHLGKDDVWAVALYVASILDGAEPFR